ncbi:hypothetical protein GCM10027024_18160 [Microbacterium insulae]
MFGEEVSTNARIPGTMLRPDAIDWSNRIVRELKPDTASGIARGYRQLRGYLRALDPDGDQGWTGVLDVYKP